MSKAPDVPAVVLVARTELACAGMDSVTPICRQAYIPERRRLSGMSRWSRGGGPTC